MRLLGLLLVALLAGGCGGDRVQGPYTACCSNLGSLGTALEIYSTDWSGRYPQRLQDLVPGTVAALPTCPAAGRDTYSASYARGERPDRYALYCEGEAHRRALPRAWPNTPSYDSFAGLRTWTAGLHDRGPCGERLARLGRLLQQHGISPPAALVQEALGPGGVVMGEWSFGEGYDPFPILVTLRGGLRVSCAGCAHLHEGLAPFQPEWRPDAGVTARRLPDLPAAPERSLPPVLLAVGAVVAALTLAGRRRWRREPRAAGLPGCSS